MSSHDINSSDNDDNDNNNNQSDQDCHVEMPSQLPIETGSVAVESISCAESIIDDDTTMMRTPSKANSDRSFSSDEETQLISPWASFRDEDNRSTGSNSSWGTNIYVDMKYTMVSNLFFFLGASVQTYTAIVDLKDAREEALEDDDVPADDDYTYTVADKIWYTLYSLGPLLYFFNSFIHVRWMLSHTVSPWVWPWWSWCFQNNESTPSIEIQNEQFQRIVQVGGHHTEDTTDSDDSSDSSMTESSLSTAYGSEIVLHLISALLFGAGAIFEFYSTLLDDVYSDEEDADDDEYLIKIEMKQRWFVSNYKADFIGMHLYLLSGITLLIAQRNSYRSSLEMKCCSRGTNQDNDKPASDNPMESDNQLAQLLMFLGTVLFVCGTLLDCSLSYMSDPAIRHDIDPADRLFGDYNAVMEAVCDLTSSLMWNIDAVLFMWADVLLYSLHKEGSKGRKWLCKRRVRCSSSEEDEDIEDYDGDNCEGFIVQRNETSFPVLPEFDGVEDDSRRSLLSSSPITNYSAL